jgi:hypothetical protein
VCHVLCYLSLLNEHKLRTEKCPKGLLNFATIEGETI